MFAANAPCQAVSVDSASAMDVLVGCRVWWLRQEKGVATDDLAAAIGVSSERLGEFECGRVRMDAATLFRIARVLEIRPVDIFGG